MTSTEFTTDELKLLLVAVRQMRRTFAAARKSKASAGRRPADAAPPLESYEELYDELFQKLRRLAGPIPEAVEEVLE